MKEKYLHNITQTTYRLLQNAEIVPDVYNLLLYTICYAFIAEGAFLSTDGTTEYFDMVVGNYRSLRIAKKSGLKIWEYNIPEPGNITIMERKGLTIHLYRSHNNWLVGINNAVKNVDKKYVEHIIMASEAVVKHIERQEYKKEGRDKLTGLLDRGALFTDLKHLIEISKNKGLPLYILFIDLNNFKAINDILGHKMGDRVLISIAHEIRNQVKDMGNVYRYGGDEFIVVLCSSDDDKIYKLANRIELATEQAPGGISISASIGIERYNGDSIEEFINKADQKMYNRKKEIKSMV